MRFYKFFNNIENKLLIPMMFSSALTVLIEIIKIILYYSNSRADYTLFTISELLSAFVGVNFVYFITINSFNEKRHIKAFVSVFSYVLFYAMVSSETLVGVSIIFAIVIAYIDVVLYKNSNIYFASIILIVFSLLLAKLYSYLLEYFNSYTMQLAKIISAKGILSSVMYCTTNLIYQLFDFNELEFTFMHKSFGGAEVLDGQVVTGASDMFAVGYKGIFLSNYVSGKYILLFGLLGIGVSLCTRLKGDKRTAALIITLCAVVSGNVSILLLFIFFICPYMLLSLLVISISSYAVASIIDIRIGIIGYGGAFEVFTFINKPVYFILVSAVIFFFGYFAVKYNTEKFGLTSSSEIYIPSVLESFVNALGGVENIIKVNENNIEVRNVKRINELELDCNLKDNRLYFDNNKNLIELKEYL